MPFALVLVEFSRTTKHDIMKRLILIFASFAATSLAFAQSAQTQCVNTAVNLKGDQLTLTTSGARSATWKHGYVYYEKKRHRKNDSVFTLQGVAAESPSKPLLLNSSLDVTPVPERYNVSVSLPEQSMTACPDSLSTVAAILNVERVASYTGNYPANKTAQNYRKVSKRDYKMAMRKKRKIERKEEKIARRAEVNVEVRSTEVAAR